MRIIIETEGAVPTVTTQSAERAPAQAAVPDLDAGPPPEALLAALGMTSEEPQGVPGPDDPTARPDAADAGEAPGWVADILRDVARGGGEPERG